MNSSRSDRRIDVVILLVTLLAFGLRTGWPTLAEFKYDEANIVRRALEIAYEGTLPIVGVDSSTGVKNLPLMLYLMALPLRLWADPAAAVLFTGWLNTLAVVATYRLGKTYFNVTTGRIGAFLFAVGGWAVLYGRKIWAQILPIFTVAFIAALLATVNDKKRWPLIGAFAMLAALIGLHLGGLIFAPILALTLLIFHKRLKWRTLLVGIGVFGLSMAPYGIHDALHGWSNARGLLTYAGGETMFSLDALQYAARLIGSTDMASMAGVLADNYMAFQPDLWWLNTIMAGLLALSVLYAVLRLFQSDSDHSRSLTVLLIWFALPIASQLRTSSPTQPHYFILLYPVQFLFIGFMLSAVLNACQHARLRRLMNAGIIVALAIWGVWQITNVAALLPMMTQHPTTGGYGIPLRYTRAAAALVNADRCPGDVVILSRGETPAFDETPAVFDALLFHRPRRFADGELALPVPAGENVAYLVGPIAPRDSGLAPMLAQLDAMAGTTRSSLQLPDGWRYQSYCRPRADREDLLARMSRFPADVPFANQVVFTAYGLPETTAPGDTIDIWLAWWLRETPSAPVTTQFYVHLRNENGETMAQFDGNGYPAFNWKAGDLVIHRFPVTLPDKISPGEYEIRAGMYTLPDINSIPVVNAEGNPIDDGVTLGAVNVTRRENP